MNAVRLEIKLCDPGLTDFLTTDGQTKYTNVILL